MKRKLFVDGHLGNAPETKKTTRGTEYVTFRLANRIYTDPEDTTYWYTITVWDPAKQKWCMNNLKKGSFVEVSGDVTDRSYTSTKTNQSEIGRDITADYIGFCGAPRREDDNQTAQTAPQESPVQVAPSDAKPVTPSAPKEASADNDLPF